MTYINPFVHYIESDDWDASPFIWDKPRIIGVRLLIGEMSDSNYDAFQMEIVNFKWIIQNISDFNWSWGRAKMFMNDFSLDDIKSKVQLLISERGPYVSWPDFANKMHSFLIWELEGLPYPPFVTQT